MKKKNIRNSVAFVVILQILISGLIYTSKDVKANPIVLPSYTIKASSVPYKNQYKNYSTYNKKTRQYYTLRSYLEQLEKTGGGTIILSKGLYNITNTLYIPSGVTLRLKDGVVIKKGNDTGVPKVIPSKSLFQLIAPRKSTKKGAVSGYNGETGICIIGEGKALIDLNFVEDSIGIILGHNTNISIIGITFQNMKSGHFIELDASRNITIKNNNFLNHKPSTNGNKEAINIDTPDKNTEGFHEVWTSFDATPNKDIVIEDNTFTNLERAIGTHKYSEGKYHENVQIIHNTITNTDSDAIRVLNWKKPVIKDNQISMVAGGNGGFRAILASGVSDPVITDNVFADTARPIQIMPWKNSGPGSQYAITYNEITKDNITMMLNNELLRVGEQFIRINKSYNIFDQDTEKYYYTQKNTEED